MALNHEIVGRQAEPQPVSWTSTDALLYAVSLGIGHDDQFSGLEYTTENTAGVQQQVVPSYGVMIGASDPVQHDFGDFDPALLVHAEQGLTIHRPLTADGSGFITSKVIEILDKGSGALVRTETAVTTEEGDPWVTTNAAMFIRGEGGFGGSRGSSESVAIPEREPDHTASFATWNGQALLYRLNGDRNPLHADPAFAARGGFDKPILHGLCTYGISCVLLGNSPMADGKTITGLSGRFSATVTPGDELTVRMWDDGDRIIFQTVRPDGVVAFDRGVANLS